jgi:hypothetical protein
MPGGIWSARAVFMLFYYASTRLAGMICK